MNRNATLALLGVGFLVGACAYDPPVMTWRATRDDAAPLDRARERCEYESTAATQAPDYSFRSALGQEIDRNSRRTDLMRLCMRVQGYELRPLNREGIGPQTQDKWAALEQAWTDARNERARVRAQLVANPTGPDAERQSERIQQLNTEVRSLERQLSYNLSPPVSSDPNR